MKASEYASHRVGSLTVSGCPPGAKVMLDSYDTFRSTPTKTKEPIGVPIGEHTIVLIFADGNQREWKVVVRPDVLTNVIVDDGLGRKPL